ncbi:hypothetical protein ACFO5O_05085 [Geojedonia litorea]|uniref:DUF4382 domain-containing protein n=1 Tax=Geojedonia litorea TaxID=1268269 RepID=A0ABV9N276_9FLAO
MKNLILFVTFIGSLAFLTSCSKDDSIGSGNATLKISASIANISSSGQSSSRVSSSRTMNESLNFVSGYVWVSEIEFDGSLQNGPSINRRIERFSKIDFETGIATPSLDDIIIPTGTYSYVNLGVELRDEDAQPSIIMEGTYTHSNGNVIPIRFEFNSGEVFEAESSQQVEVTEDQTVLSRIVFDPHVWFSVVPTNMLDNANLTDGTIIISETKNESIFDLVADRLDVSTESTFE